MIISELKELISNYPDDMEVAVSNLEEVFQLLNSGDLMYFVPKTKELYLERINAEKDGKIYQRVLVLWVNVF